MLLLAFLLISSIRGTLVDSVLPPLIKYEHIFSPENFTIKNRQNFKYQFESYGDPEVNIVDTNGKSAHNSCAFVPYSIDQQLLAEYKLPGTIDIHKWRSLKTTFAVVKFQHLIFSITNSMELTAFNYTQNRISKEASIVLEQNRDDTTDSQVYFALTSDESLLFVFSAYGVWRIQTHAVLTRIEKLPISINFTVYGAINIGDWMLVTTMSSGIIIYEINNKNLVHVGSIVDYEKTQIYPIDLAFDAKNGLLFALDNIKNIYVYKMVEKAFYYFDVIEFQHSASFKISAVDTRIYYSFIEGNAMQIAELEYNSTAKKAELVRYYKEFDYTNDFIANKDQLLVLSYETLDIYHAYVDPRLITSSHNGIRLPLSARKIQHVISDLFLFTSEESIRLMKLKTNRGHIMCNFKTVKESIDIQFKANVTDCSTFSATSPKTSYNSYCETSKKITIEINIPEEIERQRILMYAIVIMVIMFFFAGLICLVQWRNGRLDIIDKLADQIRRHKDKERRARQFVQENDIELPRSVIFSNDDIKI